MTCPVDLEAVLEELEASCDGEPMGPLASDFLAWYPGGHHYDNTGEPVRVASMKAVVRWMLEQQGLRYYVERARERTS